MRFSMRAFVGSCATLLSSLAFANFDSTYGFLADGVVNNGVVHTSSNQSDTIRDAVRNQLHYALGYLDNIKEITPQTETFEITEMTTSFDSNLNLYVTNYKAKTDVVVPRTFAEAGMEPAIVPLRADYTGFSDFETKYKEKCGGSSPLWYYYQPMNSECGLSDINQLPSDAFKIELTYTKNMQNVGGKSPEYSRMWDDGKLVITAVFGNINSFADRSFIENAVNKVKAEYGEPTAWTYREYQRWTDNLITFNTPNGTVELHALDLTDTNFRGGEREFEEKFAQYSKDSDFVYYNGHAGLGQNVEAMTRLATFKPNNYQIYYINACHPWAYLKPFFFEKISQTNDGAAWSKHVDIMSTTANSTFADGQDLGTLMTNLVKSEFTYLTLLESIQDSFIRGVVMGDEDNH